jgi:hypothetical protein
MTSIYDGPTRHEILLQIMKYNKTHYKLDNIRVSNAYKSSDLIKIGQMVEDETNGSESAQQLKASIKELQQLRRDQLKKGPKSSRNDWVDVWSAGRKLVEAAERAIARPDANTAATQDQGRHKIKTDVSKAVMKPTLFSSPKREVKTPQLPLSPQPFPTTKAVMKPTLPSSPKREVMAQNPQQHLSPQPVPTIKADHSKRVMKPVLPSPPKKEIKPQKPQRPLSPQYVSNDTPPPSGHALPIQSPKKPEAVVKNKRPQNPEGKERQRQFIIRQKEMMAHFQAQKLHDEVTAYEHEK